MKNHIHIPKTDMVQSFIAGAPDAQHVKIDEPTAKDDEHQKQISLKLPLDLLAKIDAAARDLNLSRASFIKMQMTRAVGKD